MTHPKASGNPDDFVSPPHWGDPPWTVDFSPERPSLPAEVDLAIVGGGFTGLAVSCAVRRRAPQWSVLLLEAGRLGSGASGRTGGIVLDETAVGALPGLGNVLDGFTRTLADWEIDCELSLPGCWEISRRSGQHDSPIAWNDSGTLRAERRVPGGTIDPGRLVAGLARAAQRAGALLCEYAPVTNVRFQSPLVLELPDGTLRARHVVFATEAYAHLFTRLGEHARSWFTLALATAPLAEAHLSALGLAERIPFFTVDLPYLWGRVFGNNQVIFGGGLVDAETPAELAAIAIDQGEAADRLSELEKRVHRLHPVLKDVGITHRWGGPISFPNAGVPIFMRHPDSPAALVVGAYFGQGVALSVHLSHWIADTLLDGRPLPAWERSH